MADLAFKISPENLAADFGGFESWSAGTSSAPDGWIMTGTAGSVARESSNIKFGVYSLKIISGSSSTYNAEYNYDFITNYVFRNGVEVPSLNYFPGKTFKAGIWVLCSSASKARIYLNDGVAPSVYSSYHSGGGSWEFLEVTIQVSDNATQLKIGCEVASSSITAYFDGVILCEGELTFTQFRGNTVYVKDEDFDAQVTFSIGNFEIPRKHGTKTYNVYLKQRIIKIRIQIFGNDFPTCRSIFDTIVKAVSGGRKDLWYEDDRFCRVHLTNIPKLEYLASGRVYYCNLDFLADEPFFNYISKYRQKTTVSSSPTSFSIAYNGSIFSQPRFIFIPPAGVTITSLTLENLTTGQRFSYTTNIAPLLTMSVDSYDAKLFVNAVDGLSYFTGDFLELVPGTNYMKFTGTAGITIFADWYDRFL